MANWFKSKADPALVPTDLVLPLRFWDDTVVLKSLVVYSLARYDVALDAEKLREGLEGLVARKGWRKLGARLRKNVSLTLAVRCLSQWNLILIRLCL
jgi:hypothetical protein